MQLPAYALASAVVQLSFIEVTAYMIDYCQISNIRCTEIQN